MIKIFKPVRGKRKGERGNRIRETTPPASPERERWRAGDNYE